MANRSRAWISIGGFKGIPTERPVELDLGGLTVLAGPNSSGKSSFLMALDLLIRARQEVPLGLRIEVPKYTRAQGRELSLAQILHRGSPDQPVRYKFLTPGEEPELHELEYRLPRGASPEDADTLVLDHLQVHRWAGSGKPSLDQNDPAWELENRVERLHLADPFPLLIRKCLESPQFGGHKGKSAVQAFFAGWDFWTLSPFWDLGLDRATLQAVAERNDPESFWSVLEASQSGERDFYRLTCFEETKPVHQWGFCLRGEAIEEVTLDRNLWIDMAGVAFREMRVPFRAEPTLYLDPVPVDDLDEHGYLRLGVSNIQYPAGIVEKYKRHPDEAGPWMEWTDYSVEEGLGTIPEWAMGDDPRRFALSAALETFSSEMRDALPDAREVSETSSVAALSWGAIHRLATLFRAVTGSSLGEEAWDLFSKLLSHDEYAKFDPMPGFRGRALLGSLSGMLSIRNRPQASTLCHGTTEDLARLFKGETVEKVPPPRDGFGASLEERAAVMFPFTEMSSDLPALSWWFPFLTQKAYDLLVPRSLHQLVHRSSFFSRAGTTLTGFLKEVFNPEALPEGPSTAASIRDPMSGKDGATSCLDRLACQRARAAGISGPSGNRGSQAVVLNEWLEYLGLDPIHWKPGHSTPVPAFGPTEESSFDLLQVGDGVQQILPLLVQAVQSKPGAWLIWPQPELHLHPRAQARIAELGRALFRSGRWLVVETHSSELIEMARLLSVQDQLERRRKVSKGVEVASEDPPLIRIYFFRKTSRGVFTEEIEFDSYGRILNWPEGFLDERQELQKALLESYFEARRLEGK